MSEQADERQPTRDGAGRWTKGATGNPGGRPKGTSWHQKMRRELQERTPEILAALAASAAKGDPAAAKLLLDRVLPHARPGDLPITLPNDMQGAGIGQQARAIMAAVAGGKLAVADATDLLSALGSVARVVEVAELEDRIAALEAAQAARGTSP